MAGFAGRRFLCTISLFVALKAQWPHILVLICLFFLFAHTDQQTANQDQEDNFHNRPAIKLPVPDHLKALLVDDWENVTKNQQLVPLPHVHPVSEILNDYLAHEKPNRPEGSASLDVLEETMSGLREYFDKSLGRILLYRYVVWPSHSTHA